MEAFWREKHRERELYWLTSTQIGDLLALYEIEAPVGLAVTEVGIGTGSITRALAQKNEVCAIDIAPEALAAVADCAKTELVWDLLDAPPADLAICHLVLQHCDSAMVEHILSVPLKQGGTLLVQTAYAEGPIRWEKLVGEVERGQVVWHSRDKVWAALRRNGLEPFWERTRIHDFMGDQIGWALFKCRRG